MSEADKMFEELGYERITKGKEIRYRHIEEPSEIIFDLMDMWVCVSGTGIGDIAIYFDMQELKAINKKCQEMGWL